MAKKANKLSMRKRLDHLATRKDETGRRVATRLKAHEAGDILALRRGGYTVEEICELTERSAGTVRRVLAEEVAKHYTNEVCEKYASAHMAATQVAAANGDAGPAMDMMDRLGMVPAASRERVRLEASRIAADGQRAVTAHLRERAVAQQGPVINIGIGLPNVTPSGQSPLSASEPDTRPFSLTQTPELLSR